MPVSNNTATGNAILGLRGKTVILGLKAILESGGKMQLTRTATPTNLKAIATEFTGKKYGRGEKATRQALADMEKLAAGKNLDELGETAVVNKEVGGVAADLAEGGE